jgi:hypothetical protein
MSHSSNNSSWLKLLLTGSKDLLPIPTLTFCAFKLQLNYQLNFTGCGWSDRSEPFLFWFPNCRSPDVFFFRSFDKIDLLSCTKSPSFSHQFPESPTTHQRHEVLAISHLEFPKKIQVSLPLAHINFPTS